MIHKDLVELAENWLKEIKTEDDIQFLLPCGAVVTKSGSSAKEQPYAIGFTLGASILVEAKLSGSDLGSDKRKNLDNDRDKLGDYRMYIALKGVIPVDNMPSKYGLLEVDGPSLNIVKEPEYIGAQKESEVALLASVVRRFQKKSRTRKQWN